MKLNVCKVVLGLILINSILYGCFQENVEIENKGSVNAEVIKKRIANLEAKYGGKVKYRDISVVTEKLLDSMERKMIWINEELKKAYNEVFELAVETNNMTRAESKDNKMILLGRIPVCGLHLKVTIIEHVDSVGNYTLKSIEPELMTSDTTCQFHVHRITNNYEPGKEISQIEFAFIIDGILSYAMGTDIEYEHYIHIVGWVRMWKGEGEMKIRDLDDPRAEEPPLS